MILNKIKLEDFISHKKTELELGYGINVVVGPNGAGKTSILDGIIFALFNDSSSRGKKENLINSRAKKCKVELGFTEGGIGYDVEWVMERKGSARGALFRLAGEKKNLLVRGGERSVVPEIQKVLGIDKNMFLQSVYVRQGEIEKLVTARPGDRKELISRLLGVEELDRAWNGMKVVIQAYVNRQIALEAELARKPVVDQQRYDAEAKSKELSKLLGSKRKELDGLESDLKSLEAVLEELDAKKKDFDRFDKERGLIEQRIETLESKLITEREELAKAVSAAEIVSKLEADVNRLPFLDSYVSGLAEKENLEVKRSALQEKLDEIRGLKKTLEENGKGHDLYLEKDTLLSEKNRERKAYEGSDAALAKAKKQLEKCEKDEKKKKADLTSELEKYSSSLGESVSVDSVAVVLERAKAQLEVEAKEFDAKVTDKASAISVLNQRIKELDENLSKFSGEAEAKACPTCDTELPPERVSQLVGKYSSQRSAAKEKVLALDGDLQEVKRQRELVYGRKREVDGISVERLGSLAAELAEVEKDVVGERLEVSRLEKQAELLKAVDKELERLEIEKRACEVAHGEFELAKRRLEGLPSVEEIEAEKKPLTLALEEILGRLKFSLEQLGYEPEKPQDELIQLRKKKEEFDRNVSVAKRKSEYESGAASTTRELASCRDAHSKTVRAIDELGYYEEAHRARQEQFKQKGKEVKELTAIIIATEQDRVHADDEARKCRNELKALEAKTAEKKLVDGYISVLGKVRDAYGKDGIQKMIRARARPLLEKTTRDLFERFNLAYSDIKIDDDYNISVIGPSGEQDIDQISGGERVALAIALRLAIAQVLSGRIETVIMDEPTTHLDEERRRELVNILNSFFREGGRIIPQMLIITHHSEIEEVADIVYSVKKKEGYSTVESGKFLNGVPL
jgi:exonuclease SbcC